MITLLSLGIATSINTHVAFLLSWIMSGLLIGINLLVHTWWIHNMVTLHIHDMFQLILVHGHTIVCCLLLLLLLLLL